MDQHNIVLAALAPAKGKSHSPVQVQKLLFLIDREMAQATGGPHFNFVPYDYGPFDSSVYSALDMLALAGLVEAVEQPGRRWKSYRLTVEGQRRGEEALASLPSEAQAYISEASSFIRRHSFASLVSAIYRAYPDMKVNSVFGR